MPSKRRNQHALGADLFGEHACTNSRVACRSVTTSASNRRAPRRPTCTTGVPTNLSIGRLGVDHRDDSDALFQRADGRDLGEIGDAGECDAIPAARMRHLQHARTILARAAEE